MLVATDVTDRTIALVIFAMLWLVYSVTVNNLHIVVSDTAATSASAWQLAHHGNLTMDAFAGHEPWLQHVHGRWVAARFPGAAFAAVPAYLIVRGGPTQLLPGSLTAALTCAIAMALFYLILRASLSRNVALAGTLVLALGTSVWSVAADALWTHGPALVCLAVALWSLSRERHLLAGLALGGAAFTRPPLVVVAIAVLVPLLLRRRARTAALLLPGLGAGLLLLLWYNHLAFHRWGFSSGYSTADSSLVDQSPHGLLTNLAGAFFSPGRGLFVFAPFLLLALPRIRSAWRNSPGWERCAAAGGLAYLLLVLWLVPYTGGDGFYSYRLPIEALALACPLLLRSTVAWVGHHRPRRLLLAVAVTAALVLQAAGALWYPGYVGRLDPWRSFPALDALRGGGVWGVCALTALGGTLMAAVIRRERRAVW